MESNKLKKPDRYIKFTLNGTNITDIQKKNYIEAGYTKIDTNFDIQSLTPDTSLTLAQFSAILFSVKGNNGPYKTIKSFINAGGVLDTDEKKNKFLELNSGDNKIIFYALELKKKLKKEVQIKIDSEKYACHLSQ